MTTKRRKKPLNFDIVIRQIAEEYLSLYGTDRPDDKWSLKNCIELFRIYYKMYYSRFGDEHPNLTKRAIREILEAIPEAIDEDSGATADLSLRLYPHIIDRYLHSDFSRSCN